MAENTTFQIVPASAERWGDLETLFGKNGASAGCWCMFWRLNRTDFKALKGEGTKAVLKSMTLENRIPGLLAYVNGEVAGWCALGPREDFQALENSRILIRVDDQLVWSIVCFFISRPFRKIGLMDALLRGALDYAAGQGAHIVEAYPLDLQTPQMAGQTLTRFSGYMGIASTFRALGFIEVGRASDTQVILRYFI
jgi:GNAT superfamily N-acetyltransferase